MKSQIIIAIIVLVVVAAHIAIYRWVKFKIHEGVILQFLGDGAGSGTPGYHHEEAISAHTDISLARVVTVCHKSVQIDSAREAENSWRAGGS